MRGILGDRKASLAHAHAPIRRILNVTDLIDLIKFRVDKKRKAVEGTEQDTIDGGIDTSERS